MCCGLICALAGTVAGVGAFFSTAAVSSWLFPATGAVASGAADVLIMSPLPQINPKLVPKILPEAISSIGQVSGAVLLVEHFLFLLIIGWWASSKILGLVRSGASSERVKQQQPPLAELCQMQALSDRIRALTGPASVFEWDDVKEAPPPSMDMDALADGQVAAHIDGRGKIYRFKLKCDTHVNMYFTKAGHMRSGDLHDSNQYDVVLKGRVRLTVKDPITKIEQTHEYRENDFIIIPARWPHIFEFLEDNCLLEWWDGPFKAWYYEPMRQLIEQHAKQQASLKGKQEPT